MNSNHQSIIHQILSRFPNISWEKRTLKENTQLIYLNKNNPRFPLLITMTDEESIYVGVGKCEFNLKTSEDINEILTCIDDYLNDRIIVAFSYSNEKRFDNQEDFSITCPYWCNNQEDMKDFDKLLKDIQKPCSLLDRLKGLTFRGIIEISDCSGQRYQKVYRK